MKLNKFKEIEYSNVSYAYPESKVEVLKKINIKIKLGEIVGILGESGSGKSTLIDIIMGLLKPIAGKILVDGRQITNSDYRIFTSELAAYMPQNQFILDDYLWRNITLVEEYVSVNSLLLESSIRESYLSKFISTLPNGIESIIGEKGGRISGGQAQRIALARAFYHDREIIVMDEPTSALDANTATEIMNQIIQYKGIKTIVLISHSIDLMKICDRLYTINEGFLKEFEYVE